MESESQSRKDQHSFNEQERRVLSRETVIIIIAIICCMGGCIAICRGSLLAVVWSAVCVCVIAVLFDRIEKKLKDVRDRWEREDAQESSNM